ncbi:hypothetical protein C8R43DRAFT_1232336 [Mycena crocata]|nr:hypothetical protein C8R43DRAFT_1232336 [Mycena crocata]
MILRCGDPLLPHSLFFLAGHGPGRHHRRYVALNHPRHTYPTASQGPLLLGFLFNAVLYGLVAHQYLSYWNFKFNDPVWIKTVVVFLFILDTAHTAVSFYEAWHLCVTNFNNPHALKFVDWTIPFTAVATSTSGVVTQFFLIHRVFHLTKSKPLVVILLALSTAGFVFGCIAGIKSGIIAEAAKFKQIIPIVICWLTLLSFVDLLITGILIHALTRNKTGFYLTDTIINQLIRGAVQTGLFASMFAFGDLFAFVFAPETTFYAMFAYPIGRIYTNSLLDTLNTRMAIHRMEQAYGASGMAGWQASAPYSIHVAADHSPASGSGGQSSIHVQRDAAWADPIGIPLQDKANKAPPPH